MATFKVFLNLCLSPYWLTLKPFTLLLFGLLLGCAAPPLAHKNQFDINPSPPVGTINRQAWVMRHHPSVQSLATDSAFTLGNGGFAVTSDITGFQTLANDYFKQGFPLETKARWAWHSQPSSRPFKLQDTFQTYAAYGRQQAFPTQMNTAAATWLRQNPHDFPLGRINLLWHGQKIKAEQLSGIHQTLNMWQGQLNSRFVLDQQPVAVTSWVHPARDQLIYRLQSPLLKTGQMAVNIEFPRGYDLAVKNTPDLNWNHPQEHDTQIIERTSESILIQRKLDDAVYFVRLQWLGAASVVQSSAHQITLTFDASIKTRWLSVHFSQQKQLMLSQKNILDTPVEVAEFWQHFWQTGAAVDFSGSQNPDAFELERRIVLSRYVMAVQSRQAIPPQETGLTASSWYGKFHTEMTFWHLAHWILWGNTDEVQNVLDWYVQQLPKAQALAKDRGLTGARWPKMMGPNMQESPGGNPLIIWNQPQLIHLAELLYQRTQNPDILKRYAYLVDQTAEAMASMLSWNASQKHYELGPPIWIAQEIYDPVKTLNPSFELAYWRYGLSVAQQWRQRQGLAINAHWQKRLARLAPLPIRDQKYVAIESIPDTFYNPQSRQDHPSFLAIYGVLNDPTVDPKIMENTLNAVMDTWDWQGKIWGWDFPMLAMTAARLNKPDVALKWLLKASTHQHYLPNGQVPQPNAQLPVYLPANGALLTAVAMFLGGWTGAPPGAYPGFAANDGWSIQAEGFNVYP